MAIRIEPEATTKARVADELVFGGAPDEVDQPAVGVVQLTQDLGEGEAPFVFRHLAVEGIDAAVAYRVPRWRTAFEDERQVLQRLLFPRGHVGEDVSDRPGSRDTRLHQLRVRQAGVGLLEGSPRRVESFQKLPSVSHRFVSSQGDSGRLPEGQVDTVPGHEGVVSLLERQDTVIAKPGGTAPDDHIAVSQWHATRRVGSTPAPEQEEGR